MTPPKKTRKTKKPVKVRKFEMGRWWSKRGVELTRCSNTLTEAQFFAFILSHCRRITARWKPKYDCLEEGKRPYTGTDKRTKFEYHCQGCDHYFKAKEIQIDHIIPCGGINGFDRIVGWFERALCENDGFQRLCLACHLIKSNKERRGE